MTARSQFSLVSALPLHWQALATDLPSTFESRDMIRVVGFDMTRLAADQAYTQAGVGPQDVDVIELRKRVGMVFQKSNPFPKSIYENIAYGLRIAGVRDRRIIDETVEDSLRGAALWEEGKDRLHESALSLGMRPLADADATDLLRNLTPAGRRPLAP